MDNFDLRNLEIYETFNIEKLNDVESLKKYSNTFGKAALHLINIKIEFLPIFVLAHLSIELYLKSLYGGKKILMTHNLEKILSTLPKNILTKDVKNRILAINKIGLDGFAFRYPTNKKGDKYKNFEIEFLQELNYSLSTKKNNMTITKGIKQSPVNNYLKLIDDIKFILNSFIINEKSWVNSAKSN